MSSRTKNLFLLHLIILIFGFTGILGKLISIDALPLVFWRCLIGAIALGIFMAIRKSIRSYSLKTAARFAVIGLITAAHWITFFGSIKVSTVSVALATLASASLFVSFLEPLFHRKRIDPKEIVLGILVIVGLVFIFSFETSYRLGVVLALISAFLAALFSVLNSLEIKKYDALNISLYELSAAAIGTFIFLAISGNVNLELVLLSTSDWVYMLLLGTIATAFAFVVSVEVMKVLTPFTVAISINLEPIYSIVLALIIFGDEEKMTPQFYIGAVIILGAIFVEAVLKRKSNRKQIGSNSV